MRNRTATVLWVDMTLNGSSSELQQSFAQHCEIRRTGEVSASRTPPHLICMEYDYPDRQGLQLLLQTKKAYPSIPILMVTLQHSEALAVWAFRARVWDYLVRPCTPADIDRVCMALDELIDLRAQGPVRRPLKRAAPLPTEERFKADGEKQDVQAAIEYIHAHYGEKISETTVATLCGMNRFQFSRAFSKTQGITFHEYLIVYRIREACRLFQNPKISVTDAALMVGFSDVSHFGRMFKRHCGVLPSAYRAELAGQSTTAEERPQSELRSSLESQSREALQPARLGIPAWEIQPEVPDGRRNSLRRLG